MKRGKEGVRKTWRVVERGRCECQRDGEEEGELKRVHMQKGGHVEVGRWFDGSQGRMMGERKRRKGIL